MNRKLLIAVAAVASPFLWGLAAPQVWAQHAQQAP
jgi:hypothetical protein